MLCVCVTVLNMNLYAMIYESPYNSELTSNAIETKLIGMDSGDSS